MSLQDLVTSNACAPEHIGAGSTTVGGAGPSGSSSATNPLTALTNALHNGPPPASSSSTTMPTNSSSLPTNTFIQDSVSLLHSNIPDPLTHSIRPPLPPQPQIPISQPSGLANQFFTKQQHPHPSAATAVFERAFLNAKPVTPSTLSENTYHQFLQHQQQQPPLSMYQSYVPSSASSSYAWHRSNFSDNFARLALSQPSTHLQIPSQIHTQPPHHHPQQQQTAKNDDIQELSNKMNALGATTGTDTQSWGDEFSSFETADPLPDFSSTLEEATFELTGGIDAAYASWLSRADELRAYQSTGYQFSTQPETTDKMGKPMRSAEEALSAAISLRESGRLPPAIAAFEEALNRPLNDAHPPLSDKNASAAWYLLGISLAESDDDEAAIRALEEGLDVYKGLSIGNRREDNPHLWNTLIALSVSYTNELDEPKALRAISEWSQLWKAVRTGDAEAGMSASMETLRTDMGERVAEQLKKELKRASEDAPEDADVFVVMGIFYNLNREYDLAVEAFRHAVMLRPQDSGLWNKLGATLANGGNNDEALRSYRKAVDLNPALIRAWVNVGTAYSNRGELQKAMRYYLKGISMANDRDAQGNLQVKEQDHMHHVWSFLRVTVMSMSRPELLDLVDNKNIDGLRAHFNF